MIANYSDFHAFTSAYSISEQILEIYEVDGANTLLLRNLTAAPEVPAVYWR